MSEEGLASIPEDFSTVEINNVTDYPRHREYLRNRRARDISNGDVLAHTRQSSELTISHLMTSVFERKAYIYQILVKEELGRVVVKILLRRKGDSMV